jgi:hypothetical protein
MATLVRPSRLSDDVFYGSAIGVYVNVQCYFPVAMVNILSVSLTYTELQLPPGRGLPRALAMNTFLTQ